MAKRIILTVIILAMLTVVAGTLAYFFIKPEVLVEKGLPEIAADYYENDFYDTFANVKSEKTLAERLEHYSEVGFAEVYLRQLLILKGDAHKQAAAALKEHCNENRTYVQYYPEPPYGRTDYRVEYVYSCDFE